MNNEIQKEGRNLTGFVALVNQGTALFESITVYGNTIIVSGLQLDFNDVTIKSSTIYKSKWSS